LWRAGRALGRLGPGFITGVADDDPSAIATYYEHGHWFGCVARHGV